MPSASSAVSPQPNTPIDNHRAGFESRRVLHRLFVGGLGVIVGLALLLPVDSILAPAAAASSQPGSCSGWNSTTKPPDYIRVLRNRTGRVERVPFKKYVVTVMGKEWPSYLPQAVIDAGAVAVKQFAWFHTLGNGRVSRRGQCYDVTDGVGDQLYKPGRARVHADHYTALRDTWDVRLMKNGDLFMTGYRTGNKTGCGHDATGWKLFARSAVRCAARGMGYLEILRTYYGPGLNVVDASSSAADLSASSTAQFPDSAQAPAATQAPDTTPAADATQPAPAETTQPADVPPATDPSMPVDVAPAPHSALPADLLTPTAPYASVGSGAVDGVDSPAPLGQRPFTAT